MSRRPVGSLHCVLSTAHQPCFVCLPIISSAPQLLQFQPSRLPQSIGLKSLIGCDLRLGTFRIVRSGKTARIALTTTRLSQPATPILGQYHHQPSTPRSFCLLLPASYRLFRTALALQFAFAPPPACGRLPPRSCPSELCSVSNTLPSSSCRPPCNHTSGQADYGPYLASAPH